MIDNDVLVERIRNYRMKGWIKKGTTRYLLKRMNSPVRVLALLNYIEIREKRNRRDRIIINSCFILLIATSMQLGSDLYYSQNALFHMACIIIVLISICIIGNRREAISNRYNML